MQIVQTQIRPKEKLYTKVSGKMANVNCADPDQTNSIRVYTVCHSIEYFKKQLLTNQKLGKKKINK